MRPSTRFAAAVLVVGSVCVFGACSSSTTGTGTGTDADTALRGSGSGTAAPGTCDSACAYYLHCKDAGASSQGQCVQACQAAGFTSPLLSEFQQLECTAAVAAIEGTAGGATL